ncbi:hypothetical protein LWI28_025590 [Acer negundo]|uniref:Uncharacterized protein n=1 Tax=Acer negundo TaxID=4023 RepID=A0AAD5J1Q0_ACENE|nr:hypothetical protein LWI28_025590 [Acer negundo]
MAAVTKGAADDNRSGKYRGGVSKATVSEGEAVVNRIGQLVPVNNAAWNLEKEVAKIIEVGAQLGLNFNGKEAEMAEILRSREMEDADQARDRTIKVSSVTDHVEALDIRAKSTDFDDDDGGGLVSHVIITC